MNCIAVRRPRSQRARARNARSVKNGQWKVANDSACSTGVSTSSQLSFGSQEGTPRVEARGGEGERAAEEEGCRSLGLGYGRVILM